MKFLLTLFICTGIGNSCLPINQEMFNYRMIHDDFNSCIKDGLGQSFEVFYNSPLLTEKQINESRMYPKFVCAPFQPEQKLET
jgi:hypothetical protein